MALSHQVFLVCFQGSAALSHMPVFIVISIMPAKVSSHKFSWCLCWCSEIGLVPNAVQDFGNRDSEHSCYCLCGPQFCLLFARSIVTSASLRRAVSFLLLYLLSPRRVFFGSGILLDSRHELFHTFWQCLCQRFS